MFLMFGKQNYISAMNPKSISLQQYNQQFCGHELKPKQSTTILQMQAEYIDTYGALCFTVT